MYEKVLHIFEVGKELPDDFGALNANHVFVEDQFGQGLGDSTTIVIQVKKEDEEESVDNCLAAMVLQFASTKL